MKRVPAQWEKQKSIMLVFPTNQKDWQHSIKQIQESYIYFINTIREFQKCIIIVHDKKLLENFFTSFENLDIHEIKTNDTWIRDFGAIELYIDDKLISYNFIFNAWGNKFNSKLDNNFNKIFFKKNLKNIDFILEGGSIISNGNGVLLTTSKCIFNANRNSTCSKDEVIKILKELFGLKELIVLNHGELIGDDTDSHIDMLARFINEDSIVYVKCYDKHDEHFKELTKMENELKKTKFNLIPLPLPKAKYFKGKRLPASYINFVFVNNAIIMPTYNDENDKLAKEILSLHVEHRVIKCVDASVFIREHGSLHCASINQYNGNK